MGRHLTKAELRAQRDEQLRVNEKLREHILAQGGALEMISEALLDAHGRRCQCPDCKIAALYAPRAKQLRMRGVA